MTIKPDEYVVDQKSETSFKSIAYAETVNNALDIGKIISPIVLILLVILLIIDKLKGKKIKKWIITVFVTLIIMLITIFAPRLPV